MSQTAKQKPAISCPDCHYYVITWDQHFPYGCRAHTFKSKKSPCLQVYEASGLECLSFAPKTRKTGNQCTLGAGE